MKVKFYKKEFGFAIVITFPLIPWFIVAITNLVYKIKQHSYQRLLSNIEKDYEKYCKNNPV